MGLNAKQKAAVEYLDGPLLVLAGPGTGKTQLLSEKVAYILKNTDTNPENILCLTFTESGASNMRERLKTIISKDALKVNIGTYHAFGSEILVQYKNYAPDYDRRLDAAIDEVAQFKVVKEIQDGLLGDDILRGDNVRDIISVIGEAKKAGLSAAELRTIARQNIEDSTVLSEAISPLLQNVVPRVFKASYENAYLPIYNILKDYEQTKPIVKNIERNINILARDLKEAMAAAESAQKIKPLTEWRDRYFEKDHKGNYRLKDRVANQKLLSLAAVMEKYEKRLRDNGWYDFNDMIEEAIRVLREDAGFRMTLQEKYQFIMLDEFQDTNPSQFEIVKQLTDYEKPMIMAVGDDDQAIYEFQGALSSNLTDFQAHYFAEVIPLVENYRSTQEILDFSRCIINQAADRFADKELVAHKVVPEKSQICRYEFNSSDAEYGFVAQKIADLIDAGVPQSQIAVISYKTKYFEPLLPYLKAHEQIKIAYEKRDDLLKDEKMHEIFTLIKFIDELADAKKPTVQVMEVLSYDFLGLPMLEVVKMVGRARAEHKAVFEELAEAENPQMREVATWLAGLVVKAFNEPLDVILHEIVARMKIENLDEYERFRFYENLASLKGKLYKHFGAEKQLKVADLVEMLDDYEAAGMQLTATSPYRDADEAVQILTAHKAKGLEFEYVFIISVDHTAWGKGKGNNNLLTLPRNLTQIRHTGITDSERLRVLYVALTRAKSWLYLTNSLHDFNDKAPDRLEYLEEYADGEQVVSPYLPSRKVQTMYDVAAMTVREQNLKNWLATYIKTSPDMHILYKERMSKWRMSASALTTFVDIIYAGPEVFFKNYVLQVPREPETEELAMGDLMHKVFEAVTNRGISDAEAMELFLAELDKRDLASDVKQKIREKGPANLAVALAAFAEILRSGMAEVDFGVEHLAVNGVPIVGKIDHLAINEADKTIEIYDFKTGAFHKEKWQSHPTLYKYMLQLLFYKLLVNHSPQFSKYKVTRAHILFVTPDKDGEVYDKVYDYNTIDEQELMKLMQYIYNMVVSLEFLDDPEVFVVANKEAGMREIKAFIELLLAKGEEK